MSIAALFSYASPNAAKAGGALATSINTIRGTGIVGMQLELPVETQLPARNIQLSSEDASFAFVGIAPSPTRSDYDAVCPQVKPFQVCMNFFAWYVRDLAPAYAGNPTQAVATDPPSISGLNDVYIISDGTVRVTLRFPALEGSANFEATDGISAGLRIVPSTCGTCPTLDYGGLSLDVPGPSFSASIAYSVIPSTLQLSGDVTTANDAGIANAASCIYPNPWFSPETSSEVADHPTGCDLVPSLNNQVDPLYRTVNFSGYALACRCSFGWNGWFTYDQEGPSYFGYLSANETAQGEGRHGGFALWVRPGVIS